MYKYILLVMAYYFFTCTSCLEAVSKTLSSHGLQQNNTKAKEPAKGNDSIIISGENGDVATCSLMDDEKFHCDQYHKNNYRQLYTSFIKNYSPIDTEVMQYAYFLDKSGLLLTECQFNTHKMSLTPDLGSCKIRKDIKLPAKIIYGKFLPTVNRLLLIGEDSEIYQCSYNAENKITGCYPMEMKNIAATNVAFNSFYNKVYLYSDSTHKFYSCNLIEDSDSLENCFPVNLTAGFSDKNIQHIVITPDERHILLAEKSSLHYCNIDNEKNELNTCINIYNKFFNITSLAYSKNDYNTLYIIDNNIIKSCHFDDTEMHCHKMELNNSIKEISPIKLSSATVFTFFPITVINMGGYYMNISYTTLLHSNKNINVRKQKNIIFFDSEDLVVKGGSGLELHAIAGNKKCFIVDKPGTIYCSRGTLNMACYYNDSSADVINKSCPLSSYENACTPDALQYAKTSGDAIQTCKNWKMNYAKNNITLNCQKKDYSYGHNVISCYLAGLAMQLHKRIINKDGKIIME